MKHSKKAFVNPSVAANAHDESKTAYFMMPFSHITHSAPTPRKKILSDEDLLEMGLKLVDGKLNTAMRILAKESS